MGQDELGGSPQLRVSNVNQSQGALESEPKRAPGERVRVGALQGVGLSAHLGDLSRDLGCVALDHKLSFALAVRERAVGQREEGSDAEDRDLGERVGRERAL